MDSDTEAKLEVRYEPDTGFICLAYPTGIIDEEVAVLLIEGIAPYQVAAEAAGDPTFVLSDAGKLTGITPEARKVFAGTRNSSVRHPQSFIVSFGGGFAFRSLASIVGKGLMLVAPQLVLTVEAEETAGRAWLTEKRRTYSARKAKT